MKTQIGELTIRHIGMEDLKAKAHDALEEVEKELVIAEKELTEAEREQSRLARQRQSLQRFLGLTLPKDSKLVSESNNRQQVKESIHLQAVRTAPPSYQL